LTWETSRWIDASPPGGLVGFDRDHIRASRPDGQLGGNVRAHVGAAEVAVQPAPMKSA
jgi:hypothetical protein